MANPAGHKNVFRFGLFEADAASGELLKQGERVRLQDQPFRMLILLLERPGELITREELREKLWPDNTFVEFDSGLKVALKKVRDALGDDAENPRFVETLPRRGYRFIAQVSIKAPTSLPDGPLASTESFIASKPSVEPLPIPRQRSPFRPYIAVAALITLVVAAMVVVKQTPGVNSARERTPPLQRIEPAPRRSVAVMELHNASGRPENAWLSTAISEMLSTELAAGEKLRLIPGEDIVRAKRELHLEHSGTLARDTAMRAGKSLRVDVLVVGSYTAMGSGPNYRMRIDLRLQDATNGEIVAEVGATGTQQDLFELVSQAGTRVRERLGVSGISATQEAAVRAALPSTPEAARLYAQGVARLRIYDAVGARDLLEQAVAAEPEFPLAHMALASSWRRLGYDQKARTEANQALDLSGHLPRPDQLRIEGRYYEMSGDMDKAIAAYRALFALSPDSLEDGLLLAEASKPAESRATLDALRRLPEPLSSDPRIDMQDARLQADTHQYLSLARRAEEKARQQGAPLVEARAQVLECNALHTLGQAEAAVGICEAALRVFSETGNPAEIAQTLRFLGDIRQRQGRLDESTQLHRKALKINQDSRDDRGCAVSFNQLAIDYEARGDLKQAEKLYRQAYMRFLRVGHLYNATVLASNVGGTLLSQGKLTEAEKMFAESLDLARKTGVKTAEDVPLENLAELAFLRGNVRLARERAETSIARRRENNNPSSFVSILNELSEIMTAQADLTGARQNAAEALSIAQKTGAKFLAAQSQLKLATLDLEESRAAQAESAIRDAVAVFRAEKMRDDELQGLLVLARCLLMQGKAADAQAVIKEARQVSASTQNPANHLLFAIAEARSKISLSAGANSSLGSRETRPDLRRCVNTARSLGFLSLEYEARLALSELEVRVNEPAALERLAALEKEAHSHGFDLIAGKATALRRTTSMPSQSTASVIPQPLSHHP